MLFICNRPPNSWHDPFHQPTPSFDELRLSIFQLIFWSCDPTVRIKLVEATVYEERVVFPFVIDYIQRKWSLLSAPCPWGPMAPFGEKPFAQSFRPKKRRDPTLRGRFSQGSDGATPNKINQFKSSDVALSATRDRDHLD